MRALILALAFSGASVAAFGQEQGPGRACDKAKACEAGYVYDDATKGCVLQTS